MCRRAQIGRYALLWFVAFGGRPAFAWAATNNRGFQQQVGQFSFQYTIIGSDAWTAASILMALVMVVARTSLLGARTWLVTRQNVRALALG